VVRAESGAIVGSRALKVWRAHGQVRQKKRRTVKQRGMGVVAQGKAASVRRELLWMRSVGWRQAGQGDWGDILAATQMRWGALMMRV
jgi:hypothetical protein